MISQQLGVKTLSLLKEGLNNVTWKKCRVLLTSSFDQSSESLCNLG